MEVIVIELRFGDELAPSSTVGILLLILSIVVCSCCVLDLRIPLKLASRKQQNIMECRIERM